MRKWLRNTPLAIVISSSLVITGCPVRTLDPQLSAANQALLKTETMNMESKRASRWGECDYWKNMTIYSRNDVDTSYLKLIRSGLIDMDTLPSGNDPDINEKIQNYWAEGHQQTGIEYVIPPRFTWVKVNQFNQRGAILYRISRNNRHSKIDIAYCVGVEKGIGFYLPGQIKAKFEQALRAELVRALN